jgi:hypothetical protein
VLRRLCGGQFSGAAASAAAELAAEAAAATMAFSETAGALAPAAPPLRKTAGHEIETQTEDVSEWEGGGGGGGVSGLGGDRGGGGGGGGSRGGVIRGGADAVGGGDRGSATLQLPPPPPFALALPSAAQPLEAHAARQTLPVPAPGFRAGAPAPDVLGGDAALGAQLRVSSGRGLALGGPLGGAGGAGGSDLSPLSAATLKPHLSASKTRISAFSVPQLESTTARSWQRAVVKTAAVNAFAATEARRQWASPDAAPAPAPRASGEPLPPTPASSRATSVAAPQPRAAAVNAWMGAAAKERGGGDSPTPSAGFSASGATTPTRDPVAGRPVLRGAAASMMRGLALPKRRKSPTGSDANLP